MAAKRTARRSMLPRQVRGGGGEPGAAPAVVSPCRELWRSPSWPPDGRPHGPPGRLRRRRRGDAPAGADADGRFDRSRRPRRPRRRRSVADRQGGVSSRPRAFLPGSDGDNFRAALWAFQEVKGLPLSGKLDADTWRALGKDGSRVLKTFTVSREDAAGPRVFHHRARPGADAAHAEHLHFDLALHGAMANTHICE